MSDAAEPRPPRPTLAVATIGHHRHGKTTLTAAITQVLARRHPDEVRAWTVRELDARGGSPPLMLNDERLVRLPSRDVPPETPASPLTVTSSQIRYVTPQRAFVHVDSPGRRPWLKNASRAQALVDALILVVSGPDGVQAQTHEHLRLAQALGLRQLVVFISKCELVRDLEWLDLVEQDVRELLGRCGFDGDATRIIRGAALPVCRHESEWDEGVHELIAALETELALPLPGAREGSPLLYVHRVYSARPGKQGVIVEGRVRRGTIRRGDLMSVVGYGDEIRVTVSELESDRRKLGRVGVGELAGLLLTRSGPPLRVNELRSGQALAEPSTRAIRSLTAQVGLLATDEGGRRTPVRDGHRVSLLCGTTVISGLLRLPDRASLEPGGEAELGVELLAPVHLEAGMPFLLRDGNQGPLTPKGTPPRWAGTAGMGRVLRTELTS